MKGKCPKCGKIIDEVEYTQFGMCIECFKKGKKNSEALLEEITKDLNLILLGKIAAPELYKKYQEMLEDGKRK
jgi:hypothetical protein